MDSKFSKHIDLGIKVTKHPEFDLYLLNYGPEAPKDHPLVVACRGTVIDANGVVHCRPFKRFFNWGEVEHRKDIENATCFEKLDGSLINVWVNPFNGETMFTTRGSFEAETSWGNKFRDVARSLYTGSVEPGYTECYEFTSPENRVFTPYSDWKLTALAKFKNDGTEVLGFSQAKQYRFDTKEGIDRALAELPETDEGYVLLWDDGTRVKVKNPAYVAKIRSTGIFYRNGRGLSHKRALEVYFTGEMDEYLTYFPEDKPLFAFVDDWKRLLAEADRAWSQYRCLESKKELALAVRSLAYASAMFAAYEGTTPSNYLTNLPLSGKIKLLEKYQNLEAENAPYNS